VSAPPNVPRPPPPPGPASPHFYKFKRFGNPEILFNLTTFNSLNWFLVAVAAANVLSCWILAFYIVRLKTPQQNFVFDNFLLKILSFGNDI
jgi:hypothetical protein